MRKVHRSDILDYQTYADGRDGERQRIMEIKRPRRVHLGPVLTFLFENAETMRYQIQEVMRAERIVRDADIQQELDTYNGLLGDEGELGCCLLVEIDDREERERKLREWRHLPDHVYLRTEAGLVRPTYDRAQVEEDRISAVQYLKFKVGPHPPLAIGCDLPALTTETILADDQKAALAADLSSH
jgi:hypothetical protein